MPHMTPLYEPAYGASFTEAVRRYFARWNRLGGRSSRSEYWWVFLFQIIVGAVVGATATIIAMSAGASDETTSNVSTYAGLALSLILLIPTITLSVRRLHDGGFSGWLYLLTLIPFIGGLVLFILFLMPTKDEPLKPEWEDKKRPVTQPASQL